MKPLSRIGDRITLARPHPWGGSSGVVQEWDPKLKAHLVLLDNGRTCYVWPIDMPAATDQETIK